MYSKHTAKYYEHLQSDCPKSISHWGEPEQAPHRQLNVRELYIYVCMVRSSPTRRHSYMKHFVPVLKYSAQYRMHIVMFVCSAVQVCSIHCHVFRLCLIVDPRQAQQHGSVSPSLHQPTPEREDFKEGGQERQAREARKISYGIPG